MKYPFLSIFQGVLIGGSLLLFFASLYIAAPSFHRSSEIIPVIPYEIRIAITLFGFFTSSSLLAAAEILSLVLENNKNIRSAAKNSEELLEHISYIRSVARYAGAKMTDLSKER
jgi:hypothetical protein